MTLPHDFWETRFREGRTPWEREGINPSFVAWLASGDLSPCRILVPGAGRSPEPAALLEAGFDVVALDLADRGDHQDVWGVHAAAALAAPFSLSLASPGYQRSNKGRSVPSSVRVRVCRSRCALRLVHCIC